nr:PREDICTED: uncharacterized protein LOC108951233 isoform X1 [Musa acuminata subsp. malaccensis]
MTFKTVDAVVSGFGGSLNSESAESSPLAPDQPNLLVFLADKDPPTNRSRCADGCMHGTIWHFNVTACLHCYSCSQFQIGRGRMSWWSLRSYGSHHSSPELKYLNVQFNV